MNWKKLLWTIFAIGGLLPSVMGESQHGTVTDKEHHVTKPFSSAVSDVYMLSASSADGWIFVKEYNFPQNNGWFEVAPGSYSIMCYDNTAPREGAMTVFVDAASVFSATLSGQMYKEGTEPGSLTSWSVTGTPTAMANQSVDPVEKILPLSEGDRAFRYLINGELAPGGLWKYSGTDVEGATVQIDWQNAGAIYNLPAALQAGQYILTAARNTQGALSANASTTIVKVEAMAAASNSADGYSTEDYVDIIYIPRNELVDLGAIPTPGNLWPTNQPVWDDGMVGDWSVFQEEFPDYYTVDVSCGTSLVEMDIDVVGVASITGTSGTISITSTIDDIASLTANQTMYLYKKQGKIEFSAVKDPAGSEWPAGYPKWRQGNTEVGTGETYTFNAPSTTGEHIITAHCGDGYYRAIKVIVFELKATDMAFNYDRTSSSNDGMNLRTSYNGTEITAPEALATSGNKKALYKKDMLITVKTRFEIEPAGITPALKVKAVVNGSIKGLNEKSITIKNTGISDGDTIATKVGFVAFNSTQKTADEIKKETYSFQWQLTEINGEALSKAIDFNSISDVTIYTISDASQSPWTPNSTGNTQPWVSALEFAINTGGANGKNASAALAAITSYLHTGHGMIYDAAGGGRASFASGSSASSFNLTGYMASSVNQVNCYDQAAAVVVLGRLLGIDVNYRFMMPFGYINTTNLVGVGNCNNPFYPLLSAPYNIKIVGNDNVSPRRTGFGNHAFASYAGMVYDACAGPVTGSQTETEYVVSTIDRSTPEEAAVAGTASDISTNTIGTIN